MTTTRSERNYSIQSNGSGTGHSADINSLPIAGPEPFPTGNNRDIPVSVQELVYGSKAAGVGTSSKSLDRHNELISSSEEVNGPRKDRGPSEGLETHVFPRTSPTDKSLVEKPKNFLIGPEEEVGTRKGYLPCGSSSSLQKQEFNSKSDKQGKASPKEQ
ncbi:hypothetical protein O181_087992 [Austropuccinia psidii MF-1]|uniref:Uncharacterized protein n=1 Tax=Austropuccinia psidii MF-1 TaxID=1389203 RepID=A0A9Q3IQQ6_9BASI|nr:hypothetical protein [Austropuccinia psidii MF-1]